MAATVAVVEASREAGVQHLVLVSVLGADYADADPLIRPGQDPKLGDYQANCAMPLGKQLGKKPQEVAAAIVANEAKKAAETAAVEAKKAQEQATEAAELKQMLARLGIEAWRVYRSSRPEDRGGFVVLPLSNK